MHDSDVILLSFLQATNEADCERHLSELITVYAAPLIRRTLWQRLGLAVDQAGANPRNPDAEDLYQEVMAKLLYRLNEMRANSEREKIKNFRQYVIRVTLNTCHDYIRAKYPERSRLKSNLRDLLERHRDFKMWRDEADEWVCGFTAWVAEKPVPGEHLSRLLESLELFKATRLADEDLLQVPLSRLVAEIFNWVGGAVEVEGLVSLVAALRGVSEDAEETLDPDHFLALNLIDPAVSCQDRLEGNEMLSRVWEEAKRLPPKQRDTFCLSFVDHDGDDLLRLLLGAGLATFSEIAEGLGMKLEQLMTIWIMIPMRNDTLADHLGASCQQVNKWRHRATLHSSFCRRAGLLWPKTGRHSHGRR